MAVYKEEKTNIWRVIYRYTDWTGEKKQTQKRGFKTKREAQAWEREQLHKATADLDMSFKSFVEQYTADMKTRIKENTWATKEHIIRTKLIPYFGKLKMSNITAQQIITWQNELMNYKDDNGKPLSPVYLKTIHNQFSALFNHAVKYYNLKENPCKKAGSMGKKKNREMLFWTKEEYLKFAEVMMDKPLSYYAFEMLYWTGIREGELLALTPADFDFEKNTVSINKSYQRLNGQDVITTPKTEKSNRIIKMPQFLADEMQDYLKMLYDVGEDDRMFTITKSYLHREMDRGSKEADVKRIRIHDIRHMPTVRKYVRRARKYAPLEKRIPTELAVQSEITVYRAGEENIDRAQYAISWTTDFGVAKWFYDRAKAFGFPERHLYRAKINPEKVIWFTDDRSEKEVMQYNAVKEVFEIDYDGKTI